ncbi:MAG: ParB N-terminal domain-containing protein [Candidatus Hadarchaeum sp.]
MSNQKEIKEIPLSALAPDPMNIRDAPKIDDDFRESIARGVIEPLIVRPVDEVEDKKAREKLTSEGKQYVITAGVRRYEAALQADLNSVPCIVREKLSDLEARCLSISENKHRKDIPPEKWAEIIKDLYNRLEGPKEQRVLKIKEMTGIGYGTIKEYLLLSDLPPDFKARLKEPEERSDFEKEVLAKTSPARSQENAPIDKRSQEIAPFGELPTKAHIEPIRVPQKVIVKLVQDDHFRKLIRKDPFKAHTLATIAALKGRDRVGEVLRLAKEWKPPRRSDLKPVKGVDYLDMKLELEYRLIGWDVLEALEEYRKRFNFPDLTAAANDILLHAIWEQTGIEYPDLKMAVRGTIVRYLDRKVYLRAVAEEVKK